MSDTAAGGRVLLVAHDADRGAEQLFLLRLARWLATQPGVEVEVLLWQGGPLLADLRSTCPVRVVDDLNRWWVARVLQLVGLRAVGARLKGLRLRAWMWRARRRSSRIFVHGASAGRVLAYAVGASLPVVAHLVDEGRPWTDLVAAEDWAALLRVSKGFVVPDEASRVVLVDDHGVDPARIRVEELFVPAVGTGGRPAGGRQALGIPEGAVVVGATGTDDWWRAPEPVVPIVWQLCRRRPDLDVHVLWTCYDDDEDALWPLRHDVANAGLADRFHVVAAPSSLAHLELSDVVLLTSRPDAFRAVSLELGLAAKPVVCFENGVTERVLGDAAVAVPYLDLEAAADAVLGLLDDEEAAAELARRAVARAGRARELAEGAPRWLLDTVDDLLA